MKKLISVFVATSIFVPITVSAQQVTDFQVCTNYRENYYRGGYDAFGNYVQGGVTSNQNNYNCVTGRPYPSQSYYSNYNYNAPVYNGYYGYRKAYPYGPYGYNRANPFCNPVRTALGATLGGGIGAALSNSRNTRRWAIPVGAAIGGLAYSC
jgi:hypothetical protein